MSLPSLVSACFALAAIIPGGDVDNAADDRAIYTKLETATARLAEESGDAVRRETRLQQCKRPHTSAVRLTAGSAVGGARLDGAEIYRRGARAAVLIGTAYKCDKCTKWHNSTASGFAVSADGVIATNHHVAAGATGEVMGVMTAEGRFFPVLEVLAANKTHDVALLRVGATDLAFLPLRDDAPAGSPIHCYSHPARSFGCLSEGIITRYFRMNDAEHQGAVFMQLTADYAQGSSGGPIMDDFGNAVGLVVSTSPVYAAPPAAGAGAKDAKPTTPSQQMVRHNCATARAILELTRAK